MACSHSTCCATTRSSAPTSTGRRSSHPRWRSRRHCAPGRARRMAPGVGMNLELEGRVAVVGGASRGLGYAIALALAREGADVTIFAREEAALAAAAQAIEAQTGQS